MKTSRFVLPLLLGVFLVSQTMAGERYDYTFDPDHSSITFTASHLVISKTTGHFDDVSTNIMVDEEDITNSSVEVTIKTASINTGNEKRDKHLKSADFFDVEKYPEIVFKSTKIEKTDEGHTMTGNLTIKDVTREVSFPFDFNGFISFSGTKRFGAEASLTINRQDYNVSWDATLDNGGLIAGNEIEIKLHLEAFRDLGTN